MEDCPRIQVLVGPAGSGKTAQLLAKYREAFSPNRAVSLPAPVRWIAPSRIAADEIRDWLAASCKGATLDPGIGTLVDFAHEILRNAKVRDRPLSPLQRRRLLAQVIDEAADDGRLAYYGPAAGSAGLVTLADRWIADLKRRDVPPDRFRRQVETGGSPRDRDLAEIYARYQGRLVAHRLYDAEGLLAVARDALRRDAAGVGSLRLMVVDGFVELAGAAADIVRMVATAGAEVWLALPGDAQPTLAGLAPPVPRNDLFAHPAATVDRLGDNALVHQIDASNPTPKNPAQARLARHLFRQANHVPPLTNDERHAATTISIIAASSVQGECEELARRVKRLLLDGVRPGEIVVAFRSTAEFADRMRTVFADYGIPTWIDARRRLAATPGVRMLLNILRLHAEDWPHRLLLRVVGDRGVRILDDSGGMLRTALERTIREAQLPAGRDELLDQILAWQTGRSREREASAEEQSLQRAAVAAHPALTLMAERLQQLPQGASLAEWIAALEQLASFVCPPAPGSADDPDAIARRAWLAGMRTLVRLDEQTRLEQSLSLAEFITLAAPAAEELSAPAQVDAVGRVRILAADAARHLRPKHLLVGNLNEQAFPRPHADSPADDDGFPAAGAAEMLLFYQLVTRPTESLTLSYTALDAKAQAIPPSPFLTDLERLFESAPIERIVQPLGLAAQRTDAPLSRTELRMAAVAEACDGQRDLLAAVARSPDAAVGASILAGIEAVASRGKRDMYGPFEGVDDSGALAAILRTRFGPAHVWSPSQLESYAACPFQFLGQHVLRLSPAPELALQADMMRRGMLLHDALARLFADHGAEFAHVAAGAQPDPTIAEALIQRFRDVLKMQAEAHPGRGLDRALREIERRQIAGWAEEFARQSGVYHSHSRWRGFDEPLAPRYFEARFGPGSRRSETAADVDLSTDKPYALPLAGETIQLTGQIDRIDVGRVGGAEVFNVIDYKSSGKIVDPLKVASGVQLQLALYAMAVQDLLLVDRKALALTAGYWGVEERGYGLTGKKGPLVIHELVDGKPTPAESWNGLREQVLARVGEIVAGVRGGWFPVASENPRCTTYCDYSKICRIAQVRSLEKTWTPPDVTGLESRTQRRKGAKDGEE